MPCQPPRPHPRPPELPRATQRVKKDLLLYTVFIKSVPASTTPVKKYVSYLLGEPPAPPHRPPSLCPPTPPRCPPWREMSPRTSARLGDPNGTDRRTDGRTDRPVAGEGCRLGGAHHPGIRGCVRDSSSKASPPPHPPTHPAVPKPRCPAHPSQHPGVLGVLALPRGAAEWPQRGRCQWPSHSTYGNQQQPPPLCVCHLPTGTGTAPGDLG